LSLQRDLQVLAYPAARPSIGALTFASPRWVHGWCALACASKLP
jgi:hypothetical protein